MLNFLLGKKVNRLKEVNLLEDKYYDIEIIMPFDLAALYNYLKYIKENNVKSVEDVPKKFITFRVDHWISDSKGLVYDYNHMLEYIYLVMDLYRNTSCPNLKHFIYRVETSLKDLELEFYTERVR